MKFDGVNILFYK